ncbi:riibosomal protein L5 (mitochondrion) [Fonticula alba]|uniref:Riibosomal protein L5 n=1 Tax=Fonticula alba TaxID=691883 RepID=A0A058Z0V8_FONAL|nr:riibosomal protein L5 [Fonticula alba]KCV67177.1 riibosomal protein L5 [Fonticula alba]|eukprot:XP_009498418.1 riibosomal protein L5 (mitochondrion) [Fonticula alba]
MKHLSYNFYNLKEYSAQPLKKIVLNSSFRTINERKKMNIISLYQVYSLLNPKFNKAKGSISNFKLRKGSVVGVYITLSSTDSINNFLVKLIQLKTPNIDLNPISIESFDKYGNVSRGFKNIKESPEFTELYDTVNYNIGYNVNFVFTKCESLAENVFKLSSLKLPLRD